MAEINKLENTLTASELIERIKIRQGIAGRNIELMDCQIRLVCCLAGCSAMDTTQIEDNPIMGELGLGIMKFVAIMEFPSCYQYGYDESQIN